jgi:hypothetical protein
MKKQQVIKTLTGLSLNSAGRLYELAIRLLFGGRAIFARGPKYFYLLPLLFFLQLQ